MSYQSVSCFMQRCTEGAHGESWELSHSPRKKVLRRVTPPPPQTTDWDHWAVPQEAKVVSPPFGHSSRGKRRFSDGHLKHIFPHLNFPAVLLVTTRDTLLCSSRVIPFGCFSSRPQHTDVCFSTHVSCSWTDMHNIGSDRFLNSWCHDLSVSIHLTAIKSELRHSLKKEMSFIHNSCWPVAPLTFLLTDLQQLRPCFFLCSVTLVHPSGCMQMDTPNCAAYKTIVQFNCWICSVVLYKGECPKVQHIH